MLARPAEVEPSGLSGEPIASGYGTAPAVDLDMHGLVGVRLVGATRADVQAVQRQVGAVRASLARTPDIVVRFVSRPRPVDLRWIEVGRSAFSSAGYFRTWHGRRPVFVRIPLDRLGEPCEFIAERGVGAIPLLRSAIRLAALARGFVTLHASAFEIGGMGVIASGWTHGGKTSTLLAFASREAHFVSDDVVMLGRDGDLMYGLATPIALSSWQVDQLGAGRAAVSAISRARMAAASLAAGALSRFGEWRGPRRSGRAHATADLIRRRLARTNLAPGALFGDRMRPSARPLRLFLTVSQTEPGIHVEPLDVEEAVGHVAASMRYEALPLAAAYEEFRFAFPGARNHLLEASGELEAEILSVALRKIKAYRVRHPYPVALADLHASLSPFCEAEAPERDHMGRRAS